MKARESGFSQETAAAKGGFSERTGRRIEAGEHQPQRGRPHDWRTRKDPLAEVWDSELVPLLQRQPQLQAMTLFEYLQQKYPGKYRQSIMRTLQRRVQQWKATSGPAQSVMFELEHQPGVMGLSDFTKLKQVQVTIAGQPLEHLLYHYRLAYSGWQYVQVIHGGESLVALSEGLQNALAACGGCPQEHRTDSLSAAYRNLGRRTSEDLTQMYQRLCQHYNLRPSRNNRGLAHENGSIESPHGYFKRRLHQALLLRGSFDFDSVAAYQAFIHQVVEQLNRRIQAKFQEEQSYLHPLPNYRYPDYEILSVRVTSRSTITVRCVTYTVPSQLIGLRLSIHLHHDRIVGFVGTQQVVELPRIHVLSSNPLRRSRCVNYRHVIDSLRLKPRAFLHCTWQQELLPDDNYRQLWQEMLTQFDSYTAARLMTEALYIAAKQDKEHAVAMYLADQLGSSTLSLAGLQQQFHLSESVTHPTLAVQQHDLSPYDSLLHHVPQQQPNHSHRDSRLSPQNAQTAPHEQPLARVGASSPIAGLDTRAVLACTVRIRSNATLPSTSATRPQRCPPTPRKRFFQL
ncbi:transposase [Chroococcidiopsis cubana SAG 39.79]|uniref:Transposase n=1 Tax=Chroococcidiopsis cubana SAG 39.79 TaxID=388085 RepID=A0AB37U7H7_9CYAN|nr:IS21 family transposase [Chroococcidiopsis cubana]RUS94189.1 transposase [Chroococcidiopsis cubana SAG 39.79]